MKPEQAFQCPTCKLWYSIENQAKLCAESDKIRIALGVPMIARDDPLGHDDKPVDAEQSEFDNDNWVRNTGGDT
jgi:hypothetical protein